MSDDALDRSLRKMRADGAFDAGVATFAHYFERLRDGEAGELAESEIEPVDELPDAGELAPDEEGARDALARTVVIKLNGGLGTSMGMTGPKSLLEVKDSLTFLDIVVRQILHLRERTGARLPLVLMNSFATREPSLAALAAYPDLEVEAIPADFLQSKVPKLRADDLAPVDWPADPALEWAPPGHGDLYPSLLSSGLLDALVEAGYEYAFVANVDNLGAVMDARILAWFAREQIPFLMEVADRTPADRKGGHLARHAGAGGRLVLREVAQSPDADLDAFQDIDRHSFFNTNTLWLDLRALAAALRERDGVLGLPMIVNRKTVDPSDAGSPAVLQLESAMGAAIDVFDGARAIRVGRERFAPVKTTSDLLALRSDAYELHDDGRVVVAAKRSGAPLVDLDPSHFKLVRDFDARFAAGAPSLVGCDSLKVRGDVAFGAGVVVRGDVAIEHEGDGQLRIEDGALLER